MGHRGSFLGFTYNGIHSSTLGLTRISVKRYTDNLIPSLRDTTTSIEGTDGMVYWGTKYVKRVFTVSFAFQGISAAQVASTRKFLDGKVIRDLIFDEWPYKIYAAKITGTTLMQYLAFTSKTGEEYFNGEGTITFTCYFPYARSRYAWQEDYTVENIPEWSDDYEESKHDFGNIYYDFAEEQDADGALSNTTAVGFEWVSPTSLIIDFTDPTAYGPTMNGGIILREEPLPSGRYINYNDWIESSRIPSRADYGTYDETTHTLKLFNAGDIPMPMRLWFPIYWASESAPYSVTISCSGATFAITNLARSQEISPTGAGADRWVVVDMLNMVTEGYDEFRRPTGRLYDRYCSGKYFGVPLGEQIITITEPPAQVDFNYLYL